MSIFARLCAARPRSPRRGQATTEYFLLVSVAIVGLAVAAYAFVPTFSEGVTAMGSDTSRLFGAATRTGSGDTR